MILLVLGRRPLLVGRAWKYFSSQPMVVDDMDGLFGPIIVSTKKKQMLVLNF